MATVMRRTGLIGEMTVVANLGDNYMRARLAKGTLNALGAHDVRVAKGSDGGQANEEIHDYEFAHVPYLAPESELDERGGHELIFAALSEARKKSHKITIVLNSALTDMAMVLRDERWDAVAPGVVSHIVLMGGIARVEQDKIAIDESAANNAFDLKSSRFVYERLLADDRFEVIVVTRHAASACQVYCRTGDECHRVPTDRHGLPQVATHLRRVPWHPASAASLLAPPTALEPSSSLLALLTAPQEGNRRILASDRPPPCRRQEALLAEALVALAPNDGAAHEGARSVARALRPVVVSKDVSRADGAEQPRRRRRRLAVYQGLQRV